MQRMAVSKIIGPCVLKENEVDAKARFPPGEFFLAKRLSIVKARYPLHKISLAAREISMKMGKNYVTGAISL